jgi:hypothetical protein
MLSMRRPLWGVVWLGLDVWALVCQEFGVALLQRAVLGVAVQVSSPVRIQDIIPWPTASFTQRLLLPLPFNIPVCQDSWHTQGREEAS